MSNVPLPKPINTWYDEISGLEHGMVTLNQLEAYKDACVREALEQAAAAVERHDKKGREFVKGSLWDQLSKEASDRIRALIPKQ